MLRALIPCRHFVKANRRTLAAMAIVLCQSVPAMLPVQSVSPSQQFIIYGGDRLLRGAVSQLAEQTKSNLLLLLHRPDNWKTPIVINLQTPQANLPEIPPTEMRFSQTGFGVKLQLDVTVGTSVDASLVERQLLRAILLEMIYRREPNAPAGSVYVQPPDWLLDGLLALASDRDSDTLLDALSISKKTISLKEFLQPRPIAEADSAARSLFRAYSFAFVKLLIDLPDGRSQLARYIDNLSVASNETLTNLQTHFPALRIDPDARWKSKLAEINATRQYRMLGFTETQQRLDTVLKIEIAGSPRKIVDLGELSQKRKLTPSERAALAQLTRELMLLTARAHPVLRPIVREYQEIVSLLAAQKRRHLIQRLAEVKALRERLVSRMNNIDDYMNWFEATQLTNNSGSFSDYLKAAGSEETKPRRRDPLSVYLNSLEDQF
jgi:hypothetical protein